MWKTFPTPKVYNCQVWLETSNSKGNIVGGPYCGGLETELK